MSILSSSIFIVIAWAIVWASTTAFDLYRSSRPMLTQEEMAVIADERIPVWAWLGGLIIFLFLFVLVPFIGMMAGLQ